MALRLVSTSFALLVPYESAESGGLDEGGGGMFVDSNDPSGRLTA